MTPDGPRRPLSYPRGWYRGVLAGEKRRRRVIVGSAAVVGLAWVGAIVQNLTPCDHSIDNAHSQMHSSVGGIELYQLDHGTLPLGMPALLERGPGSDEPYFARIPPDPWGSPYEYRVLDAEEARYEIRSAGPDRRSGTADDLVTSGRAAH